MPLFTAMLPYCWYYNALTHASNSSKIIREIKEEPETKLPLMKVKMQVLKQGPGCPFIPTSCVQVFLLG